MDGMFDTKNRYITWLVGMIIGGYLAIATPLDVTMWLIVLFILALVWIFYKIKTRDKVSEAFGLGMFIEMGFFIAVNAIITLKIIGGL